MNNNMTEESKQDNGTKRLRENSILKIAISHSKEIISAVLIGVLVTVISTVIISFYFGTGEDDLYNQEVQSSSQSVVQTNRALFIRTQISQVLIMLTIAKTHITEYYMATGELPNNSEDFNVSILDLSDSELIEDTFLTDDGIGVLLASEFGTNKTLVIKAFPSKHGEYIKWRCETNVDEKFLGFGKSKLCEYNANL
jgi:hypothetical protein